MLYLKYFWRKVSLQLAKKRLVRAEKAARRAHFEKIFGLAMVDFNNGKTYFNENRVRFAKNQIRRESV